MISPSSKSSPAAKYQAIQIVKQVSILMAIFIISFATIQTRVITIHKSSASEEVSFSPLSLKLTILLITLLFIFILKPYLISSSSTTYMVDFACFKPPTYCRVPFAAFIENAAALGCYTKETLFTMSKMLQMYGLSQETYLPPALSYIPPKSDHTESIEEVHMVLFATMQDLMTKTSVSPQQIDILIVNCSCFCPSPSLSSIIINKFKLRDDIKSYSLSGMGCSGGIAAVDLAKNLLKVHKDKLAVVLSTEILTSGWYAGNDPSMLTLNCFFRMGGAAILLTNKPQMKHMSKYKLIGSLRTQIAYVDEAYYCSQMDEDSNGKTGFRIQRGLMKIVSQTLRNHITALAPRILPIRESLRYILSFLRTKFINRLRSSSAQQVEQVLNVPNFKTAIDHFILPASGQQWVKEMEKGLGLNEWDIEPALMTFHRFGNQSSSSLWYQLAYIEAKERVKEGDKVLQLIVGSGMKCCSAVWECLRPISHEAKKGPWADCIHRYPKSNV